MVFNKNPLDEGRLVIHRGHFAKFLARPKDPRDQLIVEGPTLQALRTGEVSSLRVKWFDFDNGDLTVLDSKKKCLMMVPLDPVFAEHAAEFIRVQHLKDDDFLIQQLRHHSRKVGSKTKGEGLSNTHIEKIWWNNCDALGIPRMNPRLGRAYFACKWHFVDHKSMFGLMAILRHEDIQSTNHYLARICDYLTVKAEFYDGLLSPIVSRCTRFSQCPMSKEKCFCRSFTASTEFEKAMLEPVNQ